MDNEFMYIPNYVLKYPFDIVKLLLKSLDIVSYLNFIFQPTNERVCLSNFGYKCNIPCLPVKTRPVGVLCAPAYHHILTTQIFDLELTHMSNSEELLTIFSKFCSSCWFVLGLCVNKSLCVYTTCVQVYNIPRREDTLNIYYTSPQSFII